MANDFPPKGDITLYGLPVSCSMVPHILLKEIGVDFRYVKLDWSNGFSEEFRKVNPKQRVPVLTVGQETITELPAIVSAISYLAPDRNLLGSSRLETIRAQEWLAWLAGTVHASAFTVFLRPYRFSDNESAHKSISAKGMERVKECMRQVEERLTSTSAIASGFTAVDAFLYTIYRWVSEKEAVNLADYPRYTALFKAVRARPAVQAVVEAEGVHLPVDK